MTKCSAFVAAGNQEAKSVVGPPEDEDFCVQDVKLLTIYAGRLSAARYSPDKGLAL